MRLNFKADTPTLDLLGTKERDRLVDRLVAGGAWASESHASWRFWPQVGILIFLVAPLIAFGGCTVACAAEWVQVADLPLVRWGDLQGKGRHRGKLVVAAALSSVFIYLQDNVPALPRMAIGIAVFVAGLVLAYNSCFAKFNRVVWKHDQSAQPSRSGFVSQQF